MVTGQALLIAGRRHGDTSLVRRSEHTYRPAWWVPGGHAQTLWAKFFRWRQPLHARRERWRTPDGDFVDVYRSVADPRAPRLLLLCLLYTSDAADERSSVDLGGRRI